MPYHFEGFAALAPTPAGETHAIIPGYVHYRIAPARRAWMCFRAIRAESRAAARESVGTHGDSLAETVVIEGSDSTFTCKPSTRPPVVEIRHDGANTVRLHVDSGGGTGYLVLADAYAPGWNFPKLNPNDHLTNHFGLVSDFLSECWSRMRHTTRISVLQNRVYWGGALSGRDIEAVQKTVSGLAKLLFPDPEMPVPDASRVARIAGLRIIRLPASEQRDHRQGRSEW